MADKKPASQDEKKLTFAEITALKRGERYALFKSTVVKTFAAVTTAKETVVKKLHNAMKLAAALKRDYAAMLLAREIAPDTTEKAFFKDMAGGDLPGRVKQLATFFNAVALTGSAPLIPEAILDKHSANTLEKAAPIIEKERKLHGEGWMKSEITLDVVKALTEAGEATAELKKIRARQDAGDKSEAAESGVTPSTTLVMLLLNRITEAKDDDESYKLFVGCQELAEAWGKNLLIPATRYAEWLQRRETEAQPQFNQNPAPDSPNTPPVPDAETAEETEAAAAAS
jgi:hypothetical protein